MSALRVLILCTGNSCRSQMAEGLMRAMAARACPAGSTVEVFSAGTRPTHVDPRAIAVMGDIGIDISHHASKSVMFFVGQRFDYVITVCDRAAEICPTFPGPNVQRLHWPTDDPVAAKGSPEQVRAAFARTRDELAGRIEQWLATVFGGPGE